MTSLPLGEPRAALEGDRSRSPGAGELVSGRLAVSGMWCASCAHALEKAFVRVDGVEEVLVSFAAGEAVVRYDPARTTLLAVAARATTLGYGATVATDVSSATFDATEAAIRDLSIRLAVALFFGMWSMGASGALLLVDGLPLATASALGRLAFVGALPIVFFAGAPFLRAAYRTTSVGAPGMDTLVALGALASLALSGWHALRGDGVSYVDAATMLVTLLLAGRLIEHHARKRGVAAVRALLFELPLTVKQVAFPRGVPTERSAATLEPDALVVVDPGDVVAVDGLVQLGRAELDTSAISGESQPITVGRGTLVLAGSRVVEGQVTLRVTASPGSRRIDLLAQRARELLVSRTGLQGLAERVARRLVPGLLILAALAVLIGLFTAQGWEAALVRGVAVVVVTCPCALGLATPAALLQAVVNARRRGIVFRDGGALEGAARITAVAFDKTGTLTTGKLCINQVVRRPGAEAHGMTSDLDLLALAAAVEGETQHPVAEALRLAATGQEWPTVTERKGHLGVGVTARYGAHQVEVRRAESPEPTLALVIEVVLDGVVIGEIWLEDQLRKEAPQAIQRAKEAGLRVYMFSGDRPARAAALGVQLGLDPSHVAGGLGPEQKVERVEALKAAGAQVAFVGDGDNDAAALAAADLGIAMQASTRAALEAAPVVLQQHGLSTVLDTIVLAQRTSRIMRQNLGFAVLFNGIMIPAAMAGWVTPGWAALAMGTSSLAVTLNALRVRLPRAKS
ncbi:MAG: cadmium-translocating P-type ATPase [Deltaproteobacteria bacterium]|nr:cadmium-translocating P-type ATPase [Deltaproteobacteria bacterium]